MSFGRDLKRFQQRAQKRVTRIRVATVAELFRSIQVGSKITNAPGQPVDTGNLRASWQLEPGEVSRIYTECPYAPAVEDNVRGVTFKNHGPHSVKLTIAGFQRVVDHVTKRLEGSDD